jgi:hypothetical protein
MQSVNGRMVDLVQPEGCCARSLHDHLSALSGIPRLQLYVYTWGDEGDAKEVQRTTRSVDPKYQHFAVSRRPVKLVRHQFQVYWELTIRELQQLRDKMREGGIQVIASTILYEFDVICETGRKYAYTDSPIENYLQLKPKDEDDDSLTTGTVLIELRALLL